MADAHRRGLAFVANALLASGQVDGPADAASEAARVVARGIARARTLGHDPDEVSVDRLFRLGWAQSTLPEPR
jgi:hypothetical protein